MTVMNILMQNKELSFDDIVGSAVTLKTDEDELEKTTAKGCSAVAFDFYIISTIQPSGAGILPI